MPETPHTDHRRTLLSLASQLHLYRRQLPEAESGYTTPGIDDIAEDLDQLNELSTRLADEIIFLVRQHGEPSPVDRTTAHTYAQATAHTGNATRHLSQLLADWALVYRLDPMPSSPDRDAELVAAYDRADQSLQETHGALGDAVQVLHLEARSLDKAASRAAAAHSPAPAPSRPVPAAEVPAAIQSSPPTGPRLR